MEQVAAAGFGKVPQKAPGEAFTLQELSTEWDALSDSEQRNAGKRFRQLIEAGFPGAFDSWTTSDNERHYRRR